MKRNSVFLSVILALVLAGCGALAPTASVPAAGSPTTGQAEQASYASPAVAAQSTSTTLLATDNAVAALQSAFQQVYADVSPSVVAINVVTHTSASYGNLFNRQSGQQTQEGLGSGFVWDTKGHIVTNNHVVDGADEITVVFSDGTEATATLVATDSQSDLAVLKVDVDASLLKPVQMGNSSNVSVGQFTVAIGNPYGEQNTMTTGIVSALGRFLPTDLEATGPTYQIPDMIQTDASINPGNSGGVLLDIAGNVIGVTSAIESSAGSSAGIGFAIPAEVVSKVIPALINDGRYDHSYLGLSGMSLTSALASAMNMDKTQRGALVGSVVAGGPAATAGVKGSTATVTVNGTQIASGGDVIIAIDNEQVKTFNDIVSYLELSTRPGQKVTLTVLRDGKKTQIEVTLGTRPTAAASSQTVPSSSTPNQRSPYRTNPTLPGATTGDTGEPT